MLYFFTVFRLLFLSLALAGSAKHIPTPAARPPVPLPFEIPVSEGTAIKWVDSVYNSLTTAQRIAQLIMVPGGDHPDISVDETERLVTGLNIGGIVFTKGGPVRQAKLTNRFQSLAQTPLLIALDTGNGLGSTLDSTMKFPGHAAFAAIQDNRLIYEMGAEIARQMKQIGANVAISRNQDDNSRSTVAGNNPPEAKLMAAKADYLRRGMQSLGILSVGSAVKPSPYSWEMSSTQYFPGGLTTEGADFGQLAISNAFTASCSPVHLLLSGYDVLLGPPDAWDAIATVMKAIDDGIISYGLIEERCKRVLAAKYRMELNKHRRVSTAGIYRELNLPQSEILLRQLTAESITVLENRDELLPLVRLDTLRIASLSIGTGKKGPFQEILDLYAPMSHFTVSKYSTLERLGAIIDDLDDYNLVILGVDDADTRRSRQYGISPQVSWLVRHLASRNNVVLTLFTSPYSLAYFDDLSNIASLVMAFEDSRLAQEYAAQVIFGAVAASGRLPAGAIARFPAGAGYNTGRLGRLGYSMPEEVGLDSRKLGEIDLLVERAIERRATPGAQVLVARNGKVVYHKAFGHHTYSRENPVTLNDLYDLASITKIAATVPALMKLTEEGAVDLDHTLGQYLPFLGQTNKSGLVIREVLTHQARLQSWIPFYYDTFRSLVPDEELFSRRVSARYPYMLGDNMYMNRHYTFADQLFRDEPCETFSRPVASRMYMNRFFADSIFRKINESPLRPFNRYFYSDLGYYYLKTMIEDISSLSLEEFTEMNFYRPLGAGRLTFLPLAKYGPAEIVPTENDIVFRRQLIHGYVHDHGAAMLGGVGGHAGLFSNANDLAKLMQMLLQEGEYGGIRYAEPGTINAFTSAPFSSTGNRRAIGFDRPERNSVRGPAARSASSLSYGHSGFTGTIAWVDPAEELVYVFLSNRVHPDQFNNTLQEMQVRIKVHQAIYDAIIR